MAATSSRVMRGLAGLYVGMYFTFFILCLRRLPLRLPEKTKIRNAFPLLDLHRVALGRCQQSARGRRLGDFGNGDSLTSQNCFQHLDTLLQDADSLEEFTDQEGGATIARRSCLKVTDSLGKDLFSHRRRRHRV